jgi:hypothetical protein
MTSSGFLLAGVGMHSSAPSRSGLQGSGAPDAAAGPHSPLRIQIWSMRHAVPTGAGVKTQTKSPNGETDGVGCLPTPRTQLH